MALEEKLGLALLALSGILYAGAVSQRPEPALAPAEETIDFTNAPKFDGNYYMDSYWVMDCITEYDYDYEDELPEWVEC